MNENEPCLSPSTFRLLARDMHDSSLEFARFCSACSRSRSRIKRKAAPAPSIPTLGFLMAPELDVVRLVLQAFSPPSLPFEEPPIFGLFL